MEHSRHLLVGRADSLVSACGMLRTSLRRKSKAEAENTEGLVGEMLAKQEEDAGSGEGTVDG